MGIFDDIKGAADANEAKVEAGVDQAGDLVDSKTGGQYAGVWVVGKYPYGPRPAAANLAKPGKWFKLPVRSSFGSVNCKTTKCAVVVRRDHRNSADRSYDSATRVKFR